MSSEYDPVFGRRSRTATANDLEAVQASFERAAGPYLASPVPWLVWSLALPAAALTTRRVLESAGARGVLLLWSLTILAAGAVEVGIYARRRRRAERSTLASWALRSQGNLSLTAVVLSVALLIVGQVRLLPALWLLLLGHSLYGLGGLAFRPLRSCGLIYQLGGLAALLMVARADLVFALATGLGNLWVAVSVYRDR
jgi:hypothetical protein